MSRSLLVKVGVKILVSLNWLKTKWVFRDESDPTDILVRFQTLEQVSASAGLKELASTPNFCKVSVLLPFRDNFYLTKLCLDSLSRQDLEGIDLEIILIDNGSIQEPTKVGIGLASERLRAQGLAVRIINCDYDFNFSRLINDGFSESRKEGFLLLLNNDIELIDKMTIAKLVTFLESQPSAGCVGTTLIYPDGLVQHLFVAPGVKTVGAHPGKGWRLDFKGKWFESPRPVSATTGALLLVRSEDFDRVDGFDEKFATN